MKSNDFTPLHLEHSYHGSATSLFDAWTIPSVAELWIYQNKNHTVDYIANIKEGGAFNTVDKSSHQEVSHCGQFLTIDRPSKLIFSLAVPDNFEGLSKVQVDIEEKEGGCHLQFTQSNVDTSRNVDSWKLMLEQIQKVLATPYTITTASDKWALITAINVVLMQLTGFALSMKAGEINKLPFKDSWTAGQLLQHIFKSVSGIASLMDKPGKPAARDITEKVLELKQTFLDVTIKMQSPETIVPEEKNYDRDSLVGDLQVCLKELKEATLMADVSEIVEGLSLGEVTKLELLHFVLYHSQRHLYQMKKIADMLKL